MINKSNRAVTILFSGAIGISFSPVFVKLMGNADMGPSAIGFWRTFLGFVTLLILMKLQKRQIVPDKPVMYWSMLTGFFFFLDLMFWHKAIIFVGSGMATVLGNTQVFFTAIWGYLFFKEKISLYFYMFATVAITGILMLTGIFSESIDFSGNYFTGVILGLLTGICYSLYLIGLKKSQACESKPDAICIITWICFYSAIFLGIASIFEGGSFMPPDATAFLSQLGLGIFVQALAWWFIGNAMKEVAIRQASLILLLQPVLAMIWGYLFFQEYLELIQITGAVITLGAIYFGSVFKEKGSLSPDKAGEEAKYQASS